MLNVFYTAPDESIHEALLQGWSVHLPLDYQERLRRFRRWQDAQASLLGRLLLQYGRQTVYNQTTDWSQLQHGPQGKPYFPDSQLSFNISHTDGLVACVLADQAMVGIDIERISPVPIAEYHGQMLPAERTRIEQADRPLAAFYDYWTSKEAILKVTGRGFSLGLKTFIVPENRDKLMIEQETFYLRSLKLPKNFTGYLASSKKQASIRTEAVKASYFLGT